MLAPSIGTLELAMCSTCKNSSRLAENILMVGNRQRKTCGTFDSMKCYENNRKERGLWASGTDCNINKVVKVDLTRE